MPKTQLRLTDDVVMTLLGQHGEPGSETDKSGHQTTDAAEGEAKPSASNVGIQGVPLKHLSIVSVAWMPLVIALSYGKVPF